MTEISATLRRIANDAGVIDVDGQYDRLVDRMGGRAPSVAQWEGWIGNAPKKPGTKPATSPDEPKRGPIPTVGRARGCGKSWADRPVQVEEAEPMREGEIRSMQAIVELLELVDVRDLTPHEQNLLRVLSIDDARDLLEAISPIRRPSNRQTLVMGPKPDGIDPRCVCYEREQHGFGSPCLFCQTLKGLA